MYNKVTVIGLGTLGGFLCKHITELDSVREITIVDYDIVESKDIFKSIYTYDHIGDYKVEALSSILSKDVTVTKINKKYKEGKTKLPKNDLVIDCRDVVCNRKKEIDTRFYITGKTLIIDCRKNINNVRPYNGSYSIQLSKGEINKAAFFACQVIDSGELDKMIKNQLLQKIDLNLMSIIMNRSINKTIENKIDIIYELSDNAKRLQCIEETIKPVLQLNKQSDIEVFVGERQILKKQLEKFPEMYKTKYSIIPKNTLNESFDLIKELTNIVSIQGGISNFIVTVHNKNGKKYIELLEETGAA